MRSLGLLCLLAGACLGADDPYRSARAAQDASVQKQLLATRKQGAAAAAGNPAFFARDPALVAPQIACERPAPSDVGEIVDEGATQSGLDRGLVHAVVKKESGYDPCATSIKGAQGLMQLMPAVQMQFGVTDPYDPKQNIGAGTRLLKQLLDFYGGDLSKALGAYNAGPARVEQFGGVPPFPETMDYVSGILSDLEEVKGSPAQRH